MSSAGSVRELLLADVETLFLDIGGTLLSMDFRRIASWLGDRGHAVTHEVVRRAEAASRPVVSEAFAKTRPLEDGNAFEHFLRTILAHLPREMGVKPELARDLAPDLLQPGRSDLLWTYLLPGVPEALERFRARGLSLVAVSNSDGTAASTLERAGLAHHFDGIVDSHVVGIAKPEPGIFDRAFEHVSTSRDRVLHVGDMYFADVEGARAAGIAVVLLDPFDDWAELDCPSLPDLTALADALDAAR